MGLDGTDLIMDRMTGVWYVLNSVLDGLHETLGYHGVRKGTKDSGG